MRASGYSQPAPVQEMGYRKYIEEFQDINVLGQRYAARSVTEADKNKIIPYDEIIDAIYRSNTEERAPGDLRVDTSFPPLAQEAKRDVIDYGLSRMVQTATDYASPQNIIMTLACCYMMRLLLG